MTVSDILRALPASLPWMVLFRVSAIRGIASDSVICRMNFLPENLTLDFCDFIVLTSEGRSVAPAGAGRLIWFGRDALRITSGEPALFEQFESQLRSVTDLDSVDCVGLGSKPGLPPVLMTAEIRDGVAYASAHFRERPGQMHYELLSAVGVTYLGGDPVEDGYVARFSNRLPAHVEAGRLGGFERTANCNEFFLRHGVIDDELEAGLIKASDDRMQSGRRAAAAACSGIAARAIEQPLSMICQPPPPEPPFEYGDLVPLGFLLRALESAPDISAAAPKLREHLAGHAVGGLWPFHRGRLVTATDSALVLQGYRSSEAVEALEAFAAPDGGYFPQLWSSTSQPGRMVRDKWNSHWCQADFPTTCLIRWLRAGSGLPERTSLEWLRERSADRAGLYFANPYLVDWCLAEAIRHDSGAAESLRAELRSEILASMRSDHSFGRYDAPLSTAFAALALAALGCRGRTLRLIQLRLLEFLGDNAWNESTPFYSTFLWQSGAHQIARVNGQRYEVSLYRDAHAIIGSAALSMALNEHADAQDDDTRVQSRPVHPRYTARNAVEYVETTALAPYVGAGRLWDAAVL